MTAIFRIVIGTIRSIEVLGFKRSTVIKRVINIIIVIGVRKVIRFIRGLGTLEVIGFIGVIR
jgi:hypothetical protein